LNWKGDELVNSALLGVEEEENSSNLRFLLEVLTPKTLSIFNYLVGGKAFPWMT